MSVGHIEVATPPTGRNGVWVIWFGIQTPSGEIVMREGVIRRRGVSRESSLRSATHESWCCLRHSGAIMRVPLTLREARRPDSIISQGL
jgi:hypothetical protein